MEVSFYDPIKYNYEEYTVCKKGVTYLTIYNFFVGLLIFGYVWHCDVLIRKLSRDTYYENAKAYYYNHRRGTDSIRFLHRNGRIQTYELNFLAENKESY